MQDNINKCPACGALRSALATECPECGYNFTTSTTTALRDLAWRLEVFGHTSSRLTSEQREAQLIDIITSFRIPHVKQELLDVMYFIQPHALKPISPISLAWRTRQHEVIERAKGVCSSDKENLKVVLAYESELKKREKQYVRNWWRTTPNYIKWPLIAVVVVLLLLLIPSKDNSPRAYAERFSDAVEESKWDKAIEYILECPDMGTSISNEYLQLTMGLIEEGRVADADVLFANRSLFVNDDNSKVTETKRAVMKAHISNDNVGEALKYIEDINDVEAVMVAYIERNDEHNAMNIYRRYVSKFTKWDSELHRKVYCGTNPEVKRFLNEQGIKVD